MAIMGCASFLALVVKSQLAVLVLSGPLKGFITSSGFLVVTVPPSGMVI